MTIFLKESFVVRLERQLDFIATDSKQRASEFKAGLLKQIKSLSDNPLKCRKSIFFDDVNIRDLIFKGYVIVYMASKDKIEVFGFTKYQENPID